MLLVAATLAVIYVSNAIAVNDLLAEITSLERERDGVRSDNERLRAELLRLMSVERVTSIAADKLGMTQPAYPPVALPLREGAVQEQPVAKPESSE
jgi:cell division protein FtsL